MASNSVELSTLDAETHVPRNEISSHTGWEAIIASEARNEREVLSESYTDRAALMSSSSTMTTSILPITRKGIDAAGGEIRQKTRQQKSMTSQGLMQLAPHIPSTIPCSCLSIPLPHPLYRILPEFENRH